MSAVACGASRSTSCCCDRRLEIKSQVRNDASKCREQRGAPPFSAPSSTHPVPTLGPSGARRLRSSLPRLHWRGRVQLDLRRLPLSSGPSRSRPPPARTPALFLSQCTHKCKGAPQERFINARAPSKERFSWLVGTRSRRGSSQLIVPSELLPLPPQRQPVLPRNLQGPSRHPAPLNRSLATRRSARQSTSQNSTHTSDRQDEADATGYGRPNPYRRRLPTRNAGTRTEHAPATTHDRIIRVMIDHRPHHHFQPQPHLHPHTHHRLSCCV